MVRRLIHVVLVFLLLVIVAAAVTFLYIAWRVNRTGSQDQAQLADAIIILGARVDSDGEPGPDLRSRTLHGVSLYRRGLATAIICTGGYEDDPLSAASVARQLALAEGVPPERVLLAEGSMTTSEDASRASGLMAERGWSTAILVSHPLHLERARLLFESHGVTVHPSPTSTDLAAIPWRTRAWLTARETFGIVWLGLEEMGIPYEWTLQLSHWVYGPASSRDVN